MEKSLFEQMDGTYTQVGDYLLPNLTLPEQENKPIGIWGQRHARYLKQYHKIQYINLLTSGKLNTYLADINEQAEKLFYLLVNQVSECEDATEQPNAKSQIKCLCQVNNIQNRAAEIVYNKIIYITNTKRNG